MAAGDAERDGGATQHQGRQRGDLPARPRGPPPLGGRTREHLDEVPSRRGPVGREFGEPRGERPLDVGGQIGSDRVNRAWKFAQHPGDDGLRAGAREWRLAREHLV